VAVANVLYEGSQANWIDGITALDIVGNDLVAKYGTATLTKALKELSAENADLGRLAVVLDEVLDPSVIEDLKGLVDSAEEAADLFDKAPETANALVDAQGVILDQVRGRTRGYLARQDWGVSPAGPSGARGPEHWYGDAKLWLDQNLPSLDPRPAARKIDERAPRPTLSEPKPGVVKASTTDSAAGKSSGWKRFSAWLDELFPKPKTDVVDVPHNYQVWGRGYGTTIDQGSVDGFSGYDASVYGGIVGVDRRFNNLLLGLGGGYARTSLDGKEDQDSAADTGYGVIYAAVNSEKAYLDMNVSYSLNSVETDAYEYEGDFDAYAVSASVGAGLGIGMFNDALVLTPEVSLQAVYYDRDSYTETAPVGPDKEWAAYDETSYQSTLGATLTSIRRIENFNLDMEVQPELRTHWIHDFNDQFDDASYVLGGLDTFSVTPQARDDYSAYLVSGKLIHRF
jgi:outer membrane autotransporter protein